MLTLEHLKCKRTRITSNSSRTFAIRNDRAIIHFWTELNDIYPAVNYLNQENVWTIFGFEILEWELSHSGLLNGKIHKDKHWIISYTTQKCLHEIKHQILREKPENRSIYRWQRLKWEPNASVPLSLCSFCLFKNLLFKFFFLAVHFFETWTSSEQPTSITHIFSCNYYVGWRYSNPLIPFSVVHRLLRPLKNLFQKQFFEKQQKKRNTIKNKNKNRKLYWIEEHMNSRKNWRCLVWVTCGKRDISSFMGDFCEDGSSNYLSGCCAIVEIL